MPPFPRWSYTDKDQRELDIFKINVGGEIFEILSSTVDNMLHSKIGKLFKIFNPDKIPFVDRDPVCFNAILNLYRTGRLHVPPNICLTFFESELEFWGIHEDFIESCCWGDFYTSKVAGTKLKKYSEDSDKSRQKYSKANFGKIGDFRLTVFRTMTSGTGSIPARWVALLFAFFIVSGILVMIISTTPIGRLDRKTKVKAIFEDDESVTHFLAKSRINKKLEVFDLISNGFFTAELSLRFILCPVKLEFFRDTFNWIDLVATLSSLVITVLVKENTGGKFQAYTLVLKLPRIFRLLKLTAALRSGIDAFVLTIFACAKELQLVFFIILMVTVLFGCLIFAVEMLSKESTISSIYIGMWWAIGTLPGVGYGDYIPTTVFGQVIGSMCIMCGVIVCQMPIPVFLRNFSVYFNQASARLISQSDLLLCDNVDKGDAWEVVTKETERAKAKPDTIKIKKLVNEFV